MTSGVPAARELLRSAQRVVVLTGAGISAESGVPTFRGPGGLWKSHRPEELATPDAFRRDPRLVWEWYDWRRGLVARCQPNSGHRALGAWALEAAPRVSLVTQNVDGLHSVAAYDVAGERSPVPSLPIEFHGSLFRVRCSRCAYSAEHRDPIPTSSIDSLPRCPDCDALLRPAVVWFGEALDPVVIASAFDAAEGADVCLVIGTSALVHPAASIPLATLNSGGSIVEVNPDSTPLSDHAAISIRGTAGSILPSLLEVMTRLRRRSRRPLWGARCKAGSSKRWNTLAPIRDRLR